MASVEGTGIDAHTSGVSVFGKEDISWMKARYARISRTIATRAARAARARRPSRVVREIAGISSRRGRRPSGVREAEREHAAVGCPDEHVWTRDGDLGVDGAGVEGD